MVYGNFLVESVPETHELNPIGIYGALKLAGEKMVIAYEQVFKLPYTIIRPSALYGPRCVSRRVGQIFIENALANLGGIAEWNILTEFWPDIKTFFSRHEPKLLRRGPPAPNSNSFNQVAQK